MKALTAIKELRKAIDSKDFDYKEWVINLETFIEKYFPNTKETKINKLHLIEFEINSKSATSAAQKNTLILGKQKAKTFINEIIDLVEQKKIEFEIPPKSIRRPLIYSGIFWTIATFIAGLFFTIGLTFRSSQFDQEKFNLLEENKSLQSIILVQKDSIIKLNAKINALDLSINLIHGNSDSVIQGL